jgi:hypothetical protein
MILISVVGDFHSDIHPIFYEHKDSISGHVLLYDKNVEGSFHLELTKGGLREYITALKLGIQTKEVCVEEDNSENLKKTADSILDFAGDRLVRLNASCGPNTIHLYLGKILEKRIGDRLSLVAYKRESNEYNLIKDDKIVTYQRAKCLPIRDHLRLKGARDSEKNFKTIPARKLDAAETIYKHMGLYITLREHFQRDGAECQPIFDMIHQFFENRPNDAEKYVKALKAFSIDLKDENFGKQYPKRFAGEIPEIWTYLALRRLSFDEVCPSVHVDFVDQNKLSIGNEFDAMAMKDNHLHIIECKTGKHFQAKDLIHKLHDLSDLIDKDGKAMIINAFNDNNPLFFPGNNIPYGVFKEHDYARAASYNIKILQMSAFDIDLVSQTAEEFLL